MAFFPVPTSKPLALVFACSWLSCVVAAAGWKIVTELPGYDGPLPFELETGYVTIDELNEVNLFYYFVKSERNPLEDPLLVWLTGGPGCSGLSAMIYEIGPLTFDVKDYEIGRLPTLMYRSDTWTKVCNIIFLDSPVGTGFSYSKSAKSYKTGDTKSSSDVYLFMRKWLINHPMFMLNPLYIGGDSYSGITVPIVAQEVSNGIKAGLEPLINLKGYLVGNPITDSRFDSGAVVPFAHGMGLISDELYESTKKSCGGEYATPHNVECVKYLLSVDELISRINHQQILEPSCGVDVKLAESIDPECQSTKKSSEEYATPRNIERVKYLLSIDELILKINYQHSSGSLYVNSAESIDLECRHYGHLISYLWADNDAVREALGVHKGSKGNWLRCNRTVTNTYEYDVSSSLAFHLNLTSGGYRALVYSGDHDMLAPFLGTQAWIRSLNFSIVDDWRPWSVVGQVAGYTRTYSNKLTFATVKGAGHTAPEYRPRECQAMFERWISGRAL